MTTLASTSLEAAYKQLQLNDEENTCLTFGASEVCEGESIPKFVLVGKLATTKMVKFQVMRDTLVAIWRPGKGMQATELAPNLFVFTFYHKVDVNRILDDGPWAFENNLLVICILEGLASPYDITLNVTDFWVQVHNIPRNFFMEQVAKAIGSSLGVFIKADKKNFEGPWKTFMRIRITMDITKPLRSGMKMRKEGGECLWAEFKYERLPNFYFLYGIIKHTERFCHLFFEGANEEIERSYGSWLRVAGRRTVVNAGAQWLILGGLKRTDDKSTCPKEVEMQDTENNTEVRYKA